MPSLTFFGAAGSVTGSSFYLNIEDKKILIDCGLFQGEDESLYGNEYPDSLDIPDIDVVIFTHSHLDHVGRFPLLVKKGFKGKVIATPPTMDLSRIIMMDAAEIQQEGNNKRGNDEVKPPLYSIKDVIFAFGFLNSPLVYRSKFRIGRGIEITMKDAGHILGSSFVEIGFREGDGRERCIVFSGDLGSRERPILNDPAPHSNADIVVLESTYGDREHKTFQESVDEFKMAIKETFHRGGNVIIPSFALERTQEILYILREMYVTGEFPEGGIVFLDSPLAISATDIFLRHTNYFDRIARMKMKRDGSIFDFPALKYARSPRESKAINKIMSKAIIIAGSGMCTGGRILHHLKRNAGREECSIVFVGYQVKDTPGRAIVDGDRSIVIQGEEIEVKAEVFTIGGFSAHAGRTELVNWVTTNNKNTSEFPEKVILVHGEDRSRESLRRVLKDLNIKEVILPRFGETIKF